MADSRARSVATRPRPKAQFSVLFGQFFLGPALAFQTRIIVGLLFEGQVKFCQLFLGVPVADRYHLFLPSNILAK